MIKFNLNCDVGHEFEGWFGSSDDFDTQSKRGLVTCPQCNSDKVTKALMAPSISTSRQRQQIALSTVDDTRKQVFAEMKRLREHVVSNSEDVGTRFPEEARKIHYGEAEQRGIYGAASLEEAKTLVDEGIQVAPLPSLPEDAN